MMIRLSGLVQLGLASCMSARGESSWVRRHQGAPIPAVARTRSLIRSRSASARCLFRTVHFELPFKSIRAERSSYRLPRGRLHLLLLPLHVRWDFVVLRADGILSPHRRRPPAAASSWREGRGTAGKRSDRQTGATETNNAKKGGKDACPAMFIVVLLVWLIVCRSDRNSGAPCFSKGSHALPKGALRGD